MSAFVCTEKHVNTIVTWAGKFGVRVSHGNPSRTWHVAGQEQATANLLHDENVRSVNYRYNDEMPLEAREFLFTGDLTPIEVIKLCQGLKYQSCEHPAWDDSLAHALLQQIISDATRLLPGYAAAPWEI